MRNKMPTFYIKALGCKVSQYDAALLRRELEARSFIYDEQAPDLVIINTCSVTKAAIRKDRQLWHKLKTAFPASYFVIMGCWPQTDKSLSVEEDGLIVWGVGRIVELAQILSNIFNVGDVLVMESGLVVSSERSRYFLKVGDGCNQFCSYCIIPHARGRLSSRALADILAEAKAAVSAGYQEIVLTGIHLGLYGSDLKPSLSLSKLLLSLLALCLDCRFRLSSIEVTEIDEDLLRVISENNERICRHFHVSLQSGSDSILSAMRRPYSVDLFADRIAALRRVAPLLSLSTDIIVGFPGETEKYFLDTLEFAQKMEFAKIHVFPFSAHEKTPAFFLSNRVAVKDVKLRAAELRALSEGQESKHKKELLIREKKLYVIAERESQGFYYGHSCYLPEFCWPSKLSPGLRTGQGCWLNSSDLL